jgi:hypothetical protein
MGRANRVEAKLKNKDFDELKALQKSRLAFQKVKPTSFHKRETLAYAYEQVKPLIKRFMGENNVLALEVNLRTKRALALEPIQKVERQFFVDSWLNNEISTKELKGKLKHRFYHWVEYLNFSDFLSGVENWLTQKKN